MSSKRKTKPRARSLFKATAGQRVPFTVENLRRLSDPAHLCSNALDRIRQSASTAGDEEIEKASEYAKALHQRLAAVDAARESKHVDRAIFEAMKLTETWMQFRADVFFAEAVRAREASNTPLPKARVNAAETNSDKSRRRQRTVNTVCDQLKREGWSAKVIRQKAMEKLSLPRSTFDRYYRVWRNKGRRG